MSAALGSDGFGRSESRAELRRFFEVDAEAIAYAALADAAQRGLVEMQVAIDAREELGIDVDKVDPAQL